MPAAAVAGHPTRTPVTAAAVAGGGPAGQPTPTGTVRRRAQAATGRPVGRAPRTTISRATLSRAATLARQPARLRPGPPRLGAGPAGPGTPRSPLPRRPRRAGWPPSARRCPPERASGQVAEDIRERLGVSGGRGAGPAGGADRDGRGGRGSRTAVGYADEGYGRSGRRSRRGPGEPGQDRGPRGGGHGRGGRGGGRDGGPDGTRRRRSLGEWFRSGDWWRRWTWKKVVRPARRRAACSLVLWSAWASSVRLRVDAIPTDVAAAALSAALHRLLQQRQADRRRSQQRRSDPADPHVVADPGGHGQRDHRGRGPARSTPRAASRSPACCGPPTTDLKGGSYPQGGSTLTEQFVKNYYTGFAGRDNTDKTLSDKLKQILVAIKLAHMKSKSWIMTQYLNTVSLRREGLRRRRRGADLLRRAGQQAHRPAGRHAGRAGQPPGCFNPDPNAGAAYTALVARWQYVLNNMVRDGDIR